MGMNERIGTISKKFFRPYEWMFSSWTPWTITRSVSWSNSINLDNAIANELLELKAYWWINQIIPPNTQWPCANGYHIPSREENVSIVNAMTTLWIDTSNGAGMKTYLKIPYAWLRNAWTSATVQQGTSWRYWSCLRLNANTASILAIGSNVNNPQSNANTSYGFSIRPFKDEAVIPTSSWTTLFDWSLIATGAWIFHNTTDWIISISADWVSRITIADKNLWATVVYNDGDTLSESNCGKYYQHWNNYWFDWTWTVTTSSTKVDTTWYWPWNRYSDSTFIAVNGDWSSVYNSNLWWWDPIIYPSRPANLICNNGILKIDWQWQIYADWTTETIEDELSNTATVEILLAIWDTKDEQEILSWWIKRKIWIKVLDGTENWLTWTGGVWYNFQGDVWSFNTNNMICSHYSYAGAWVTLENMSQNQFSSNSNGNIAFKSAETTSASDFKTRLANQYANWTPVIVIYSLTTPTTEAVAWQTMNIQVWNNTIQITQASIDPLTLSAKYKASA